MLNDEELILHLQEFGIPKDECEVYVGLLNAGPTKASNVLNFVHMNRVKIYSILENLKNRSLVSSTFSSPAIFSANNLDESLLNLIDKEKFNIIKLEKMRNKIISEYKIKPTESPINNSKFTIISGKQNIFSRIEKMIKIETKEITLVTTCNDLRMMYYTSIPEEVVKSQKRGVIIKLITESEENLEIIERMKIKNTHMVNLPSKGRIVCNSTETLISGHTAEGHNLNTLADSAFFTNAEEFVTNMQCFTNQLWKSGMELSLKQKELKIDQP